MAGPFVFLLFMEDPLVAIACGDRFKQRDILLKSLYQDREYGNLAIHKDVCSDNGMLRDA